MYGTNVKDLLYGTEAEQRQAIPAIAGVPRWRLVLAAIAWRVMVWILRIETREDR